MVRAELGGNTAVHMGLGTSQRYTWLPYVHVPVANTFPHQRPCGKHVSSPASLWQTRFLTSVVEKCQDGALFVLCACVCVRAYGVFGTRAYSL